MNNLKKYQLCFNFKFKTTIGDYDFDNLKKKKSKS